MPTDEPATDREEHAHFLDIAACGLSLRANIVYRFGWTILSGCPRAQWPAQPLDSVIDLRSSVERCLVIKDRPVGAVVHIPIDVPGATQLLAGTPSDGDYRQLAIAMLRHRGEAIAEVITHLARLAPSPVALGCSLGKDRTGLVTAVLMRVLEVPRDEAIRHEAMARRAILTCQPALRSYARAHGVTEQEMRRRCLLDGSVLHDAIDLVSAVHGDTRNYLVAHGAPPWAVPKLSHALRR